MKISFADFNVEFINKRIGLESRLKHYQIAENATPDIKIAPSEEEVEDYIKSLGFECRKCIGEASIMLRKLAEWMPYRNAFLLHSACLDIDGVGIVFSALSGTGKTTHMMNWKSMLEKNGFTWHREGEIHDTGKKFTIVNGDKPFVRFFGEGDCLHDGVKPDIPYAYGNIWCGKEHWGMNYRTPLKHICFIERSDTNFVTKPTKSEAVGRIMKQIYIPKDPVALANTLHLVDRLIDSCELWIIHCNMDPESAKVAYNAIFEG
ncbi:MAG: hypothetical protein MJ080_04580 [Clostridia bacterium]|nr:hypothetical protein [Clostridia bacterium]